MKRVGLWPRTLWFVKFIGTICFDIFFVVKELYIKLLYNNMASCMFERKKYIKK